MNNDNSDTTNQLTNDSETTNGRPSSLNNMEALDQYLKSEAGTRQGRSIPPLEKWHPENTVDMDLTIKANGEWWHEGGHMTRESLVSLFATVLWAEEEEGRLVYFLKTPVQKMRITVEDVPLFINDIGIVNEDNEQWLEFTTTTGDVVRLDDEHPITLRQYQGDSDQEENSQIKNDQDTNSHSTEDSKVRPYMPVRNSLDALIGRNAFYHLIEIGKLTEQNGETILTLQSGGKSYQLSMPAE
ncbi:DUF1285 domain-containing protein [Psychrobacter sp. DM4]|uniref:DUF1285 domain-containing protein n=1 Tax=Psychrobacter sp. DM4 TaxID=3440637 RepID=UPI003F500605